MVQRQFERQVERAADTVWWHVYPLGLAGASGADGGADGVGPPLRRLVGWVDHAARLGCTGLLLGPVFLSHTHGYDTTDHFRVDPRLGDGADFAALVGAAHDRGMRVVLDGVFNHVGRGFEMYRRAVEEGPGSAAAAWFCRRGSTDDGRPRFAVFEGHDGLVVLNHAEPAVAGYVGDVMEHWLDRGVDGWRLDAAYAVAAGFWQPVLDRVRVRHPNAWFVGEMIHGDYSRYVAASGLDSVTQYELWKAIWSSINDRNLFELAWAIGRHDEICSRFVPLTFVGNHDVTRIASRIRDRRHLGHAFAVLFALPGSPCVYAGDEFGLRGVKENRPGGDDAVRPGLGDPADPPDGADPDGRWLDLHRELIAMRRRNPWLTDAVARVPHLTNEAAVIELAPRGGAPERLRLLLNLDDAAHHFPVQLAGPEPVAAHAWRFS